MSMAQQLLNRLLWWRNPPQDSNKTENLERFLCRWESCILRFQHILLWENPVVSLVCLVAVNIVFWTMVYLEWRVYGLLFFVMMVLVGVDWAAQHGLLGACRAPAEPEPSTQRVLTMEELSSCLRGVEAKVRFAYSKLRTLRQQQPATFCMAACGFCLTLTLVGRAFSGAAVLYALLMSALTVPALCVRYPQCLRYLSSLAESDGEVEEYLPEPSIGAMRILSLADEPPELPVSSRDTLYPSLGATDASLQPDVSLMPSLEHSLDFLGPDVELPSPRQVDQDLSDESDLSEPQDLQFKTRHFNGEGSSTSSGEELARGLRFRGAVQRDASSDSSGSFELISKDDL